MATSVKEMELDDLYTAVADKKTQLRKQRFAIAGAQAKDVHAMKRLRKEIAQILTEINSRTA